MHCSYIYKYLEIPFLKYSIRNISSLLYAMYLHAILHKSVVIQDNSVVLLLNGLLAELPTILDSISTVPQMISYIGVVGRGRWGAKAVAD